ncbi:MAG: lipocalin family protein [Methylococcales bacterium]|nr:lipocalin family protein [Methylococcales bacterium]
MKILSFIAILLGISTFAGIVNADITLQSNKEILGTWKLESTKQSATSGELIAREDTWKFDENTLTISNIPREGGFYDQPPVKYVIEDGKLKVAVLGRAGRFNVYTLIERTENKMVLKAKFGSIYNFSKQ